MGPPIKNGTVGDWRLSDADFLATFHLPGASNKHDKLMDLHPLPRDARIRFDEEKHEYWIDGRVKAPRSVTGLVHAYASRFDPGRAVRAMKSSARWPEKREGFLNEAGEELEDAEIVALWEQQGRIASARGTLLHWHPDCPWVMMGRPALSFCHMAGVGWSGLTGTPRCISTCESWSCRIRPSSRCSSTS